MYSEWHPSLSFSAHQTLLAGDFTDNANRALSFSIDNVIAIGNEAIKMAIKVVILLPSSRIWPFVMPIFPHAQRQVLWDSSLYLFKIKGLSNNKKHRQAALAYAGPIYWTMGKVREWELSSSLYSSSHCQRGSPLETLGQFVWSKQHKGGNSNHQTGTLDWPVAWPPVRFPMLFHSDAPFWLILTDWFCFVLPFCCSSDPTIFRSFTSRQRGSYLKLYPKDFDCNPVAFWRTKQQKLTEDKAPSTHRIPGN